MRSPEDGGPDRAAGRGRLLVTGATGVVGAEVCTRASARGWTVTRTARRGGPDVVAWDLLAARPPELDGPWDAIIHTAARPRWNLEADDAWRANVETMGPLVRLAEDAGRLIHLSSAYATGLTGSVVPTELEAYRNTYEWSKAAAERQLDSVGVPYDIVRPPLIIGRRSDGGIARFSGMYTFLAALTSSQLPALVADRAARLDLVSTTDVADCCLDLLDGPPTGEPAVLGCTDQVMTTGDALDLLADQLDRWRAARGVHPLPWPRVITPDQWTRFFKPMARRAFTDRQYRILELLEPFVPYLAVTASPEVNWPVAPMADCFRRCTDHWCDVHPAMASRDLRAWRG